MKKEKSYCPKCKHFKLKKMSKRDAQYGYCKKHDMPLLAVVENCNDFDPKSK